jgi:hypothetical protein
VTMCTVLDCYEINLATEGTEDTEFFNFIVSGCGPPLMTNCHDKIFWGTVRAIVHLFLKMFYRLNFRNIPTFPRTVPN